MNKNRGRIVKEGRAGQGPVVYWMSRDQRVKDNWALLFAQDLALNQGAPLAVIFCLAPKFLNAAYRQYAFMIAGLKQVENSLVKRNIHFLLIMGEPSEVMVAWLQRHNVRAVVTDFDPLRIKRTWKKNVSEKVDIRIHEVDAHNVVPCWVASQKPEYGAYTIRPKIHRLLDEYLDTFGKLKAHHVTWKEGASKNEWDEAVRVIGTDRSVPVVDWILPGEREARKALSFFLKHKLPTYEKIRNDPVQDGQSNLSPYLHFGQLSAQRVALEVMKADAPEDMKKVFLEELIVRRELSDNFCYYNHDYDKVSGFPDWARRTLDRHRRDPRAFIYSTEQFEHAQTHDDLWNAAQMEMVKRGKMHGYMRMYWAKKILEWTRSPEIALETAIYLNDRYELDGRDPNGYTGIAWSIGGLHDRAWNEREVFGKIRYMSYKGCKSKFDTKRYIEHINSLRL